MERLARILTASFMACHSLGFAQITPQFQFTLHFEDSIGNRDSLLIGYDSASQNGAIEPQFGEAALNTPFDSIFEVRAIHYNDLQERTVKVVIEPKGDLECVNEVGAKILINAKYPPVKILYDSTLFPIEACGNIILSPEWFIFLYPQWWDVNEYHCMAGTSMFVEDFIHPTGWNWLFVEKEVAGQGIKMLPGLFLATFYGPGPCNDTTFLSVHNESLSDFGALSPNPSSGNFSIQVHSVGEVDVVIRDVNGRLVSCPFGVAEGSVRVDASRLPAGIYFALLQDSRGRSAVYKFVKL